MKLSAVMIALNSERRLEQVLNSLSFCDEVVVIDSLSTDRTAQIAQKMGARLIQRKFDDFSSQKQYSVDQAKNDWVLVIDSDEVVTEDLKKSILEVSDSAVFSAYEIPRVLFFLGKKVSHSGGIDFPVRLFNRKKGKFNGAKVHEQVLIDGSVGRVSGFLEHYSYDSLDEYFRKFDRYTTIAAQALHDRGAKPRPDKILLSFPVIFFKLYFLKLGILDGLAGLLWCALSAWSPVVKYYKAYRLKVSVS